jgi:hypothetical protein
MGIQMMPIPRRSSHTLHTLRYWMMVNYVQNHTLIHIYDQPPFSEQPLVKNKILG